jgi:hypothetical protein
MLGSGWLHSPEANVITTRHVIGDNADGLVVLLPHISQLDDYQDTTDNKCAFSRVTVQEIDPFRDIAILKLPPEHKVGRLPIGSFDDVKVGEEVTILGFPHATSGRRVLTLQKTELGAKVLLDANGVKTKHAVINIQARPGQSGSLVFHPKSSKIVGMLIGAYVPGPAGISLGGINPFELHQTTHCISAEYIGEMI